MKKLFEETYLANIAVKNRFVRSATWENMKCDGDGHMTDELYRIYEDFVKR